LRAEHAELAATIERVVQASLPRQRQMAIERDAMEVIFRSFFRYVMRFLGIFPTF